MAPERRTARLIAAVLHAPIAVGLTTADEACRVARPSRHARTEEDTRVKLLLPPASHLRYIQGHEDLHPATPSRRASTSQPGRASAARRRDALLFHRRCRRGAGSEPGDGG